MKNLPLIVFCLICVAKGHGQMIVEITKKKQKVKTKIELRSTIWGADSSFLQNLENNITKAISARKRPRKGKYTLTVNFIISKDGSISEVRCENDGGSGWGEDVVRILKKSPKWTRRNISLLVVGDSIRKQ